MKESQSLNYRIGRVYFFLNRLLFEFEQIFLFVIFSNSNLNIRIEMLRIFYFTLEYQLVFQGLFQDSWMNFLYIANPQNCNRQNQSLQFSHVSSKKHILRGQKF